MTVKLFKGTKITVFPPSIIFIAFLVLYFITLIYLGYNLEIWEDEAYSLETSSHSLQEVLKLSYEFEGQPPFYFITLAVWRLIHSGVFFARLSSILIIGISAFSFYRLISSFFSKINVYWLVTLFLLNPRTIWAAVEIRLYALVILLSILALNYFLKYFIHSRKKDLFVLLIICLTGLYTQYFFGLLMVSFALTLWIFKNWKSCFQFCLYCIPVILLFLPNFLFLPSQLSMIESTFYSPWQKTLEIILTPQNFILPVDITSFQPIVRWVLKVPFAILSLYALYRILREPANALKNDYLFFFKIILLVIFSFIIQFTLVFLIFKMYYQSKYLILCFPFIALFFSIFSIFSAAKRNAIYMAIAVYFIILMANRYQYSTKTYNFEATSEFINKNVEETEPILFYGKSIIPPFTYYYRNTNPLYGLPPLKYDAYYYVEEIHNTDELIKQMKEVTLQSKSFLFIQGSIRGYKYKDQMTPELIQHSLKQQYLITLDTTIESKNSGNKLRIQRLRLIQE